MALCQVTLALGGAGCDGYRSFHNCRAEDHRTGNNGRGFKQKKHPYKCHSFITMPLPLICLLSSSYPPSRTMNVNSCNLVEVCRSSHSSNRSAQARPIKLQNGSYSQSSGRLVVDTIFTVQIISFDIFIK